MIGLLTKFKENQINNFLNFFDYKKFSSIFLKLTLKGGKLLLTLKNSGFSIGKFFPFSRMFFLSKKVFISKENRTPRNDLNTTKSQIFKVIFFSNDSNFRIEKRFLTIDEIGSLSFDILAWSRCPI